MTDHSYGPSPDLDSVPLSVWACGQLPLRVQFGGDYHPDTKRDADGMHPAIAAHALVRYSRPGDLVLDPDCGAGTTLTEALRCRRHTVGVTADPRWWPVARANVTARKLAGATTDGMVLDGPPRCLTGPHGDGLTGHVDLVLTTVRRTTLRQPDAARRGRDPDPDRVLARLRTTIGICAPLLRPGGLVVISARPWRHREELVDLPGALLAAGQAAGLIPVDRVVAVTGDIRGDRIAVRDRGRQRTADGGGQRGGQPIAVSAHHDVVVLRAPDDPPAGAHQARPPAPADRVLECVALGSATGRRVA